MKNIFSVPVKVLIVSLLVLQLFSLECLGEVATPVVVSSQESSAQKTSAAERVENISKDMKEQRIKTGLIDLGITTLVYLSPFIFENKGGVQALNYLIVWLPIFWVLIYPYYGKSGIYYLSNKTPIENDAYGLNSLTDLSKKEEKATFILQKNSLELQKEKGKYSQYNSYLFSPGLNTSLINKNLTEYINQNHIDLGLNDYIKNEYKETDITTKTKWMWEQKMSEVHESEIKRPKTENHKKITLFEGWILGADMDTSKANVGDYIYPYTESGLYDGTGPNANKVIDLVVDDKCLVVDQKNETNYRFIFSFKNGLWYKIIVAKEE